MTSDELRHEMYEFREHVNAEAEERRDTYYALEQLCRFYEKSLPHERHSLNEVLFEWLLSDDEGLRFDAQALIGKFAVSDSVPTLEALAERLRRSKQPGAPYELEKVNRILNALSDCDAK